MCHFADILRHYNPLREAFTVLVSVICSNKWMFMNENKLGEDGILPLNHWDRVWSSPRRSAVVFRAIWWSFHSFCTRTVTKFRNFTHIQKVFGGAGRLVVERMVRCVSLWRFYGGRKPPRATRCDRCANGKDILYNSGKTRSGRNISWLFPVEVRVRE